MTARNIEDIFGLSPLQEGMLFHSLYSPGSGLYIEQVCNLLRGNLQTGSLEAAWRKVVQRHPALRISVVREGRDRPLQVVHRDVTPEWRTEDWRERGGEEQARALETFLQEDRARGFDPSRPPLMRFALLRLGEAEWQLVWTFHHMLIDGWSAALVMSEVETQYGSLVRGREVRLPPVRPYREFISRLARQDPAGAREFWRRTLAGLASPTRLPSDFPPAARSNAPTGAKESSGERAMTLSDSLTADLQSVCRRRQLTLNTLFQGVFAILIARLCATVDVLFGNTVSGRPADLPGVDSMVGLFINTLPVRVRVPARARCIEWLQALQRRQAEAREHEAVSLVDVHSWSELPRGEPLFEMLLVFENYPEIGSSDGQDAGIDVERNRAPSFERTNYPLTVMIDPGPPVSVRIAFDRGRFEAATIERLLGHMKTLLRGLAPASGEPPERLEDLPLMNDRERRRLLVEWNDTRAAFPRDHPIEAQFEDRARLTPEAPAVVFADERVSYGELDSRANRIAAVLRGLGVSYETPVGICALRSVEMIAGLLGILKAGGAWVPLDPSYPAQRLALMIEDAGVRIVLAHAPLAEALPATGVRIVPLDAKCFEDESSGSEALHHAPSPKRVSGDRLACIFYTSGSTGRPKGVAVPHRAITRLVTNTRTVALGPEETILQFAPISFDASLFEIWGALLNGGRLVVMPPGTPSLEQLGREIERNGVTTLWLTAPLFHQMIDGPVGSLRGVRQLLAGGDVLSPPHMARALAALPGTKLINGYGPTEGTTFTCCHELSRDERDGRSIPIGRPISNTRVYILDESFGPLPVGIAGELFIGGDGLARGYIGDAALTAERFVPDRFDADGIGGGRLYRTGDLARWLPEGTIEFLGRADNQIKIRGYRVEAGEIEAALGRHPEVKEAVVAAREDPCGGRRLVGWVVPRTAAAGAVLSIDPSDLRRFLDRALPDYMVPSRFMVLDELPLTPSGKPDRGRLPSPYEESPTDGKSSRPRTPVQEILAGIWARLLRLDRVGAHDGFFDLGGHSLIATQVVSAVRERLGVEIPLSAIFEAPTVAGLAARIESALGRRHDPDGPPQAGPIRPVARDAPLPPSFAQQRLWFLDQFEPASSFYNIPLALRLIGRLDTASLERSLGEIVRRHESLRTTFSVSDGLPAQVIHEAGQFRIEVTDLAGGAREESGLVARIVSEEAEAPFDLEAGPLFRVRLLRLGEEEHILLVTMHHIVSDAWSIGVLIQEMAALYDASSKGLPSPLPERQVQYADFAAWQREWLRGEALEEQVGFWRRQLEGAPPALDLPFDRPRPAVQTFQGSQVDFSLTVALSRSLRELARREDVTVFMLLLGAFQTLLHRLAGQEDIVVGVAVANRNSAQTEGMIGFFVNMLPIRTRFADDPSFREVLARVRRTALEAWAHQDLPFERLVEALAPPRDPARPPIFQTMLVMDNTPPEELRLAGLSVTPLQSDNVTAKLDLTLSLTDSRDDGLAGSLEYNSDLFDAATIEAILARFETLLEGIVGGPGRCVSDLPVLSEADERRLRIEWNDTGREDPDSSLCLHELIERRSAHSPEAIAVSFEDNSLTYAALRQRSGALARRLVSMGVGPDVVVAVCMERSLELVVALLGVLKAGGAYLPIDPDHPAGRLAFQMKDAGCPLVLSQRHLSGRLTAERPRAVFIDSLGGEEDDEDEQEPGEAGEPARGRVTSKNLAYVIYTSGSTGSPKGVMIPHFGIVNRLLWMQREFGLRPADRVLQKTPFTFDVSVWEFFWPLLAGARLVLARPDGHRDAAYLAKTIAERGITTIHFVPSMLEQFLDEETLPRPGPLRRVICSGEALRVDLQERFFERVGAPLHNLYGPTEASVDATFSHCERDGGRGSVPIGRPIANMRAYVLDRRGRPVPPGAPGHLHLGGAGLARGYLHRPDLTAESFVPDPFVSQDEPGSRLYRTGDLARHRFDGNIEYLGRTDQQVKIRGVRIEPGEIEATLAEHPGVKKAVVAVREENGTGRRLIGYVVADGSLQPGELRAYLKTRLPEAMVPASIVILEDIPLTASGKVDRRALPLPAGDREELPHAYVPPRNAVEEALARIWAGALGVERVGATDNLFDLGGHSLLATQILHRVRDVFQVDLPLRGLFEEATIEAQTRAVVAREAAPGRSEKIAAILNRVEAMSPEMLAEELIQREGTKGAA